MKKIAAVIAAILIVVVSVTSAFAAGLNSYEQSVLANMRTPANMGGNNVYVPSSYLNQAEAHFNTIDMTAAQAGQINAIIGKGRAFLEGTGKKSMKELSSSELSTITSYASQAAAVLGLSAAAGSSDKAGIKIIKKNGEVVVDESGNVIKATGSSDKTVSFVTISVIAALLTGAAATVLFSRKKELSYEEID